MNSGGENAKAERIDKALRAVADGAPAEPVTIEVTYRPTEPRSFALRLAPSGEIVETERNGQRERSSSLGTASREERKAIARSLVEAGLARSVSAQGVYVASYVVRAAVGDVDAEMISLADSPASHEIDRAIRALYGAASRFGARPLTLVAEPARVPPPAATFNPPPPPTPPPPGLGSDMMKIGLLFANNRDNVADVELLYADGTVSSGWFASHIHLGAQVEIRLSHHTGYAGAVRPDIQLEPAKLAGLRVTLSNDGSEHVFGTPPPRRASAAPRAKPVVETPKEVLDLANKRISFNAFARWLAEHKQLWLPATVTAGTPRPRFVADGPTMKVDIFTSEAAYDAWWATAGIEGRPTVMNDIWGSATFARMPASINRVDLDAGSPITLQLHGDPLATLRAVAHAVEVERALAKLDDPASVTAVLAHTYRVGFREGIAPPGPSGSKNALMISVPGPRGEQLAAAFTSDDSAEAFLVSSGGSTSGISFASMTGRDLVMSLGFLRVEGVSVNPAGPGGGAVLGREICTRLAGTPR